MASPQSNSYWLTGSYSNLSNGESACQTDPAVCFSAVCFSTDGLDFIESRLTAVTLASSDSQAYLRLVLAFRPTWLTFVAGRMMTAFFLFVSNYLRFTTWSGYFHFSSSKDEQMPQGSLCEQSCTPSYLLDLHNLHRG